MKILACGVGMQSTALALMACEQAITGTSLYPDIPIYDAIIFCDLGLEPGWVKQQVEFIHCVCDEAGIPFYILEKWGLDTKASACVFCPFHRNYFYQYVQQHEPETYAAILGVDNLLCDKTPMPPMKSMLFMSRSRKRIADLTPEDCNDAECFEYCGQQIWNGF